MFDVSKIITDLDRVQEVYTGRPGCACGCRGEYRKPGEKGYKNVLTRALNRISEAEGTIMQSDGLGKNERWISIENDIRVYTVYFKTA